MKKWIWMPIVTVILAIVITVLFLPKTKLNGGYSDELSDGAITTNIVSSGLIREDNQIYLEIITSIWNKSNPITVSEANFQLNQKNPVKPINVVIKKDEMLFVRQVFEYNGNIDNYTVMINSKFIFDFTVKNNELTSQLFHLKNSDKKAIDNELKEKLASVEKVIEEKKQEQLAEKKELEITAKKQEQEQRQQEEIIEIEGIYNSTEAGEYSVIYMNSDGSGKVVVGCGEKHGELKIDQFQKTKTNQTYTFTAPYTSNEFKTGTIVLLLENGIVKVVKADNVKCILGVKHIRQGE